MEQSETPPTHSETPPTHSRDALFAAEIFDAKVDVIEERRNAKDEKILGEVRVGFHQMKVWFVLTSLGLSVGTATLVVAVLNAGRIIEWFAGV